MRRIENSTINKLEEIIIIFEDKNWDLYNLQTLTDNSCNAWREELRFIQFTHLKR